MASAADLTKLVTAGVGLVALGVGVKSSLYTGDRGCCVFVGVDDTVVSFNS